MTGQTAREMAERIAARVVRRFASVPGTSLKEAVADEAERALLSSRDEALEEAAKLIDDFALMDTANGQELTPRRHGNMSSLFYAAAIRQKRSRT